MLSTEEIKQFILEDRASLKKKMAREGLRYFEGDNDIKQYRVFYYNNDGKLIEDTKSAGGRAASGFFAENIQQKTQFTLSPEGKLVRSDIPELQEELDKRFDDEFDSEVSDVLDYGSAEGFSYFYRYADKDLISKFRFAEGLNVIEVEAKYASDKKDHIIFYYTDKVKTVGGETELVVKIQDWDSEFTYFYIEENNDIKIDTTVELNPRPHILYNQNGKQYYETFGAIPFYRYDNNKKQVSDLKAIKEYIDSYDIINYGLFDNILSLSEGYFCVKGFQGDNIDELVTSLKTKHHIGVPENGDLAVHTVDIPYEARKVKMELDKENIYQFGMSFNPTQVGDGNITNVVIKSRYGLLDIKCSHCARQLKKTLKQMVKDVLDEINEANNTDYSLKDVWFNLDDREVITNELDNAQIDQYKAQTEQLKINTLLNIQTLLDNETIMRNICEILDIDYEEIKSRLPKPEEEESLNNAEKILNQVEGDTTVKTEEPKEETPTKE